MCFPKPSRRGSSGRMGVRAIALRRCARRRSRRGWRLIWRASIPLARTWMPILHRGQRSARNESRREGSGRDEDSWAGRSAEPAVGSSTVCAVAGRAGCVYHRGGEPGRAGGFDPESGGGVASANSGALWDLFIFRRNAMRERKFSFAPLGRVTMVSTISCFSSNTYSYRYTSPLASLCSEILLRSRRRAQQHRQFPSVMVVIDRGRSPGNQGAERTRSDKAHAMRPQRFKMCRLNP